MKLTLRGVWMTAISMIILSACSSTKITSSWKQEGATIQKDHKVMVLALIPNKEGGLRAQIENEMVAELQAKGYNAISAYQSLGPDAFKNTDEKSALRQMDRQGIENVMTVVLLDKSKEKNYVPGRGYGPGFPFYPYYGRFWNYYGFMYNRVYDPGYYTVDTKYFLEGNLYDLQNNKLLYSVQTQSFDPSSTARFAVVYSKKVAKDMFKQGLISRK